MNHGVCQVGHQKVQSAILVPVGHAQVPAATNATDAQEGVLLPSFFLKSNVVLIVPHTRFICQKHIQFAIAVDVKNFGQTRKKKSLHVFERAGFFLHKIAWISLLKQVQAFHVHLYDIKVIIPVPVNEHMLIHPGNGQFLKGLELVHLTFCCLQDKVPGVTAATGESTGLTPPGLNC